MLPLSSETGSFKSVKIKTAQGSVKLEVFLLESCFSSALNLPNRSKLLSKAQERQGFS